IVSRMFANLAIRTSLCNRDSCLRRRPGQSASGARSTVFSVSVDRRRPFRPYLFCAASIIWRDSAAYGCVRAHERATARSEKATRRTMNDPIANVTARPFRVAASMEGHSPCSAAGDDDLQVLARHDHGAIAGAIELSDERLEVRLEGLL